jgi:hypothetical protein
MTQNDPNQGDQQNQQGDKGGQQGQNPNQSLVSRPNTRVSRSQGKVAGRIRGNRSESLGVLIEAFSCG